MVTPAGEQMTLMIPAASFARRQACGMDIGGSLIKLAYTEPSTDPTKLQIRCLSYRNEDLRDAMTDFKTRAGPALATGEPITTCGVGSGQHATAIKDILGVDLVNLLEFDRFLDAFKFLSETLPEEEFLHPESEKLKVVRKEHLVDAERNFEAMSGAISGAFWQISKEDHSDDEDYEDSEMLRYYKHYTRFVGKERALQAAQTQVDSTNMEKSDYEDPQSTGETKQSYVTYPILLYMCGSAGCPMMVTSDGKVNPLDVRPMGGRFFTAMGRLLCGAKSYEEILSLAESGIEDNVNMYPKDITGVDDYSTVPRYMLAFAMGNAATNDPAKFRPEDLAAASMTSIAEAIAEHAQLWALLLCIKNIYFVGSMVNSRLARDEIAKFSTTRSLYNALGTTTKPHFVKPCAYLGAIGCLLATLRTELPPGGQQ